MNIQFMDDDITLVSKADTQRQRSPLYDFGKTLTIYFPAHAEPNCLCKPCTLYRVSQGTQWIITINLPPITNLNTDKS